METMIGIKPNRLDLFLKEGSQASGDITGIIGFADKNIVGSVALSFPTDTALMIYNTMMKENVSSASREVMDLTGELTNIIAGDAKQELAKTGLSFHISIPTIIVGKNHTIHHQLDTPVLVIPFTLNDKHEFLVEITLKVNKNKL